MLNSYPLQNLHHEVTHFLATKDEFPFWSNNTDFFQMMFFIMDLRACAQQHDLISFY